MITEATCTTEGEMKRVCSYPGEEHYEIEKFDARGHDFGYTGICHCNAEAQITPPTEDYLTPDTPNSGIYGLGNDPYDRYTLSAGNCYELEIHSDGKTWFEVSIPEPGQYAIVSTDSNVNNITLAHHNGSAAFIIETPDYTARTLDDGNFLYTFSCSELYWSESWSQFFSLNGFAGETTKFCIVKIGEPAWQASYVYVQMEAKELTSVTVPETSTGALATEVPYDTDFFYDSDKGYYCMPNGSPIYAAITKKVARQFGGGAVAFTDLLKEGASLSLGAGTLPSGDYLVYDYSSFLMLDPNLDGSNTNTNSYQNYVNSDGLYPVTQELYKFLKLWTEKNPPAEPPTGNNADNAWLAPCFYYEQLVPGTEKYPIALTTPGTYTIAAEDTSRVYYTFTYNPNTAAQGSYSTICKITVNELQTVRLFIDTLTFDNTDTVQGIKDLYFEANSATPFIFSLKKRSSTSPITFTIEIVESEPISLGDVTLQPAEILMLTGEKTYKVTYSYTATEAGTLTLTTDSTAQIYVGDTYLENQVGSTAVAEGETVTITVSASSADAINANLSFTAE